MTIYNERENNDTKMHNSLNEITNSLNEITTASTELIYHVSLTECKEQLGLVFSQSYDDNYLNRLIVAAHQEAEDYIQKDITYTRNITSVWDYSGISIRIDMGHLNEIESIVDDASAAVGVDNTTLRVWPEYFTIDMVTNVTADPLTVTYTTGFSEDACPEIIKQAILMKIGAYYDMERSGYTTGGYKDNKTGERLLNRYRSVAELR